MFKNRGRNNRIIPLISFTAILIAYSSFGDVFKQDKTIPKRIVSLAPSITEALYLLEAEDRIIGVTTYCKYPPQAQQKEKIGTMFAPNIEKIYSLKPDLVLATKEIIPQNSILKLKELGLKVYVFDTRKDFRDICSQFLQLGKILGKEKQAKKIVNKSKKQSKSSPWQGV